MGETTELTTTNGRGGALAPVDDEFPVDRLVRQKQAVQRAMKAVMKPGEHYGIIPGTEKRDKDGRDISKPSLLQPGADTLCFLFRMDANYEIVDKEMRDDLISYDVRCVLKHIDTERKWGEGMGSCNSREKRYTSQSSAKVCPQCKKPAIIKGKKEYGGGWLCFAKKDGCGAKFKDGDQEIEGQEGQATTAGVWDLKNTILKMACKRAKVAAVLTATAASDCFTQDLEDLVEVLPEYTPPKAQGGSSSGPPSASSVSTAPASASPPASSSEPVPHDADGVVTDDEVSDENILDRVWVNEFNERTQAFEPVRQEPKITPSQLAKIHILRQKLGHHLDRVVKDPNSPTGVNAKKVVEKEGKLKQKLRDVYGKESCGDLSVREGSRTLDWLDAMVEKVFARLDRGNDSVAPAERVTGADDV
jgi:hypothetical protein